MKKILLFLLTVLTSIAVNAEVPGVQSDEYEQAVLVAVSPEAGTIIDLDTEFTFVFSQPVSYSASLSEIFIGTNPFPDGDGVIFSQSEDGKCITVRFDKEQLAAYGATSVDKAIEKFGNKVKVVLYKVKDQQTGQFIEGCWDEEEEEDQFAFKYSFSEPTMVAYPKDEATITSLEYVYLSCYDGIELNSEAQKGIIILKNKEELAVVPVKDLKLFNNDSDGFEPSESPFDKFYELTLPEEQTEGGVYEIFIWPGTFYLGGKLNDTPIIFTYTIQGNGESSIKVSPSAGEVSELKNFEFTYGNNGAIVPTFEESCNITIEDEYGDVVATITQDQLSSGIDDDCYDESGWNSIKTKVTLSDAITTQGIYTMYIPKGAFYVGDEYEESPSTSITWQIISNEPGDGPSEGEEDGQLIITDGVSIPKSKKYGTFDVTYNRNFAHTGWQSLALPFGFTANATILADIELVRFTGADYDSGEATLYISKVKPGDCIDGSEPLLVRAKSTGSKSINFGTRYIGSPEGSETPIYEDIDNDEYITIVSVMSQEKQLKVGQYVMSGGALKAVPSNSAILGVNRWYIYLGIDNSAFDDDDEEEGDVRFRIAGLDDDDATGIIETITNTSLKESFSINGVKVNGNAKGLIIKDSKKVLVK